MTVNDTDKFLVNRSGSSYHLEAQNLMAELQDDDLMLVNRSGKSYKVTGAEIKDSLNSESPPAIASVTVVEDNSTGPRFSDQSFTVSTLMALEGEPISSKAFDAYIAGNFAKELTTSTITDWNPSSMTLTFTDDQDLEYFEANDVIVQDKLDLIEGWFEFEANPSSTKQSYGLLTTKSESLIVENQTIDSLPTYLTRGPISNDGPWETYEVDVNQARCFIYSAGKFWISGRGYIYVSEDARAWTTIDATSVSGITESTYIWNIQFFEGLLYIACDAGLYVTGKPSDPSTWTRLRGGKFRPMQITPRGLWAARAETTNGNTIHLIENGSTTLTDVTIAASASWTCLTYRDGLLVAWGTNTSGSATNIAWSYDDGINWDKTFNLDIYVASSTSVGIGANGKVYWAGRDGGAGAANVYEYDLTNPGNNPVPIVGLNCQHPWFNLRKRCAYLGPSAKFTGSRRSPLTGRCCRFCQR